MPSKLMEWVRMPNAWIEDGGLRSLRWSRGNGSDNLAALMVLMPMLHRADQETGISALTYDQLQVATGLSRSKVSAGIGVLMDLDIVQVKGLPRSTYQLAGFDPQQGWAKFPARRLYDGEEIRMFHDFNLRKSVELNALKLLYLFASRRDRSTNFAHITYEQIEDMSGLSGDKIKGAVTVLAAHSLVQVSQFPSRFSEHGISNGYRLVQIDPTRHMGTTGRKHIFEQ